jgi:hypothetical protein
MVLWPHKGRGLSLVDPSILLGNFLGFVKLDLLLGISSLHDTRVILLSNRLLLDLVASTLLLQATYMSYRLLRLSCSANLIKSLTV